MASQAEKYLWLGLSRNLQSVDEDDLPSDTIGIDSFSVSLSSNPASIPNTATVDVTNKLSQSVSETMVLTANGFRVAESTISLTSGESATFNLSFLTADIGNVTFEISVGIETSSVTKRIS